MGIFLPAFDSLQAVVLANTCSTNLRTVYDFWGMPGDNVAAFNLLDNSLLT